MKVDPKLQQTNVDPFAQSKSGENQAVQQNAANRRAGQAKLESPEKTALKSSASVSVSQTEKTEGPMETEPLSSPEEARELTIGAKNLIMQDGKKAQGAQANLTNQLVLDLFN